MMLGLAGDDVLTLKRAVEYLENVAKPPNWTPPDIAGVLAKQGWNP